MRITLLRRCFECGQPMGKKEVFCPRCGARQPREPKRGRIAAPHCKGSIHAPGR